MRVYPARQCYLLAVFGAISNQLQNPTRFSASLASETPHQTKMSGQGLHLGAAMAQITYYM